MSTVQTHIFGRHVELLIGYHVFSDTATCRLVGALEDTFRRFPDGFARHFGLRNDQKLLVGNCWQEELRTTKYLFRKQFDEVGVHYKSLAEMELEADRFKGKFYCSVLVESDNHRTYYFRNHDLIKELISELIAKCAEFDMGIRG